MRRPPASAALVAPVALAVLLVLAGCSSPGTPDATTPTSTPTPVPPPSTTAADYAHAVRIENPTGETHAVRLTVSRGNETVVNRSYDVPPGYDSAIYGWEDETVSGGAFEVRIDPDTDPPQSVGFRVDDCHGNVVGSFGSRGFQLTYSVC